MNFSKKLRIIVLGIFLCSTILVTACGGGNTSDGLSSDQITETSQQSTGVALTGIAVKGPIAHGEVTLHFLQSNYLEGYDVARPIATGYTDAFANIIDINVPVDAFPPFVLSVQSENGIDLNTGQTPILTKLINVITEEMLLSGEPVYATPLTTMAYYMALNESDTTKEEFLVKLSQAEKKIKENLGVEVSAAVNFLTSPPVINDATDSIDSQQRVAEHRTAIEMLAALLFDMSTKNDKVTNANIHDDILKQLALDLQSDGVINGRANEHPLALIDTRILEQNPNQLNVPNTNIKLNEISVLLESDANYLNIKTVLKKKRYVVRFKSEMIINPKEKIDIQSSIKKTIPAKKIKITSDIAPMLRLSWDPAPGWVEGYLIYAGTTPDRATEEIADINLTNGLLEPQTPNIAFKTQTDLALELGDSICFRVKIYNSVKISEFSDAICAVIK